MPLAALGCSAPEPSDSGPESAIHFASVSQALTSSMEAVNSFGSNPGGLKLYKYVPKPLPTNAPLVLVLHGCMQGATDSATWGWNELADQYGFAVGYPEQQTANNSLKCFNWGGVYGDMSMLERGKGENQSIKQMVDTLVAAHGLDTKRVFIVGFSAGGGTALISAATWPDVYAGVASLSGLPYACNSDYSQVFTCQNPGVDHTAQEWGDKVRAAYPSYTGSYPRASIWQGAADVTVGTKNRTEIVRQWTNVNGVSETATTTETVDGAKHEIFTDNSGKALVESYEIPGMAHGVAVAPGQQCGAASTYAFDKGICQALRVGQFFGFIPSTAAPAGDGGTTTADGGDAGKGPSTPGRPTPPYQTDPPSGSTNGSNSSNGATAPKSGNSFHKADQSASTCSAVPGPSSPSPFGVLAALGLAVSAVFRRKSKRGTTK
jgi:poly(hydroxyalkanoate) depolymerase family esterase